MTGNLTIRQARLVLPDRVATGDLVIEDGVITHIGPHVERTAGEIIDGTGLTVLPGVIDPQVHFRDPGFTWKEDLASGSRAAAAGGVTAFLEMPNTDPATVTVEELHRKLALAAEKSVVHYGFFIGATGENNAELHAAERTCGVKIFMGASTGKLLVADRERLESIFAEVDQRIAVHAEDEARLRERRLLYQESTDPADHPRLRDVEAALTATKLAVELALKHGRRLHVLHISSAEEADFLASIARDRITAETCPQYLFLDADEAYARLGTRAQCNPPIRASRHRGALWSHLQAGTFDCIATDHAPHTIEEKARPYPTAPSGLPGVEWSLPLMLDQVVHGRVSLRQVARWMCEGPAQCYGIHRKGRLEVGYDGDIVLVDLARQQTITPESVHSRCGWSPYEGLTLSGWPVLTAILGRPVFRDGAILDGVRGRELTFDRHS
jgi:dihydroorotase